MDAKCVGFLVFDGMNSLDLAGPMEAFTTAVIMDENGVQQCCYKALTIGLTSKPFAAESGLLFKQHKTIKNAPALDTLIIPGGHGLRRPEINAKAASWVKSNA